MIGKRSYAKNIVIAILVVLVLALGGLSTYLMFFKEEVKDNNKKEECVEKKDDEKENENVSYKIEIYGKKGEDEKYIACNHKSDSSECKDILFSINTDSSNASVLHASLLSSFPYIIYYDNGVKLYNVKDESISKIEIDLNGEITWLDEGIINNNEDDAYYYDLKENKKIFDKYDEMYPVLDNNDVKYIQAKKGNNTMLLDFKTGNVLITIDNSNYNKIEFKRDGSYIIASLQGTEKNEQIIYNTKGEKKVELESNQTYEIQGSKLVVYEVEQKKVKEY